MLQEIRAVHRLVTWVVLEKLNASIRILLILFEELLLIVANPGHVRFRT